MSQTAKFYKLDKATGKLVVAAVKIAQPSFDRLQEKPYPSTHRLVVAAMARLGFRLKKSLPAALRRLIPQGGLSPNYNLSEK